MCLWNTDTPVCKYPENSAIVSIYGVTSPKITLDLCLLVIKMCIIFGYGKVKLESGNSKFIKH